MIGNTLICKITYKYNNKVESIYAKLEYYNYSGSIKDRIIKHILDSNDFKKGDTLVEATSGNTGISLSALGSLYGYKTIVYIPKQASKERINLMKLYGSEVVITKDFKEAIEGAKLYAEKNNAHLIDQFNNKLNVEAHYKTTGPEIYKSVPNIGAFISGIGSGGTLMGISSYLKKQDENILSIALEPSSMPLLTSGKILGPHKIEGIGDDFIPSLVDRNKIDKTILIDDNDAVNMSRLLSKKLGLGVGISSGANFIASVLTKNEIDKDVVTVFADDSKKYLSTDLSLELDLNNNFISNQIELLKLEII